ncbi:MmcQ/YjbR family DNA-binding protein [Luedemannella helvata]|uniref:MmcQ/YjbR family DNA-binding protein n=1 Tax=Luedemannella helvata TaxID=349315 RepID=A0ABN2JZH5_9ACTN
MAVTLAKVRAMCLALPEVTEELTWEVEATWRIRGKIFVMGSEGSPTISVKTSREEQEELLATDPRTYTAAAYVGRFGWTSIRLAGVQADELRELIIEAWRRTAPKKLVKAYDAGG